MSNVDALKLTFLQANNLKPLRIMIWGPPVAGKTSMAEVISKQYYLKRIHAKYLVDEVLPEVRAGARNTQQLARPTSTRSRTAHSSPSAAPLSGDSWGIRAVNQAQSGEPHSLAPRGLGAGVRASRTRAVVAACDSLCCGPLARAGSECAHASSGVRGCAGKAASGLSPDSFLLRSSLRLIA